MANESSVESLESIKGLGPVKNTWKYIGSMGLTLGGEALAGEAIAGAIMENPRSYAVLRIIAGLSTMAAGIHCVMKLEREPTAEQLEEFYFPRLPLE